MNLPYIRDTYRVPAYLGARVAVGAREGLAYGTIVGSDAERIVVKPDRGVSTVALHPDQLTYLKDTP